jgi:hypothetical protein
VIAAQAGEVSASGAAGPSSSGTTQSARSTSSAAAVRSRLLSADAASALAATLTSLRQSSAGGASLPCNASDVVLRLHAALAEAMRPAPPTKRPRRGSAGPLGVAGVGGVEELGVGLEAEGGAEAVHASDAELEAEVRGALQSDAMASYDLDVQEEGDILELYTALCASARGAGASGSGAAGRL